MKRIQLSEKIETTVLLKSRRRCCICFGLNRDIEHKPGQIAHLDHNSSNNKLENLAFLCLTHHDQYDTKTSQSKNLTLNEVKHYRKQLYEIIVNDWKKHIIFDKVTSDLSEKVAGHYIRDGEYDSAELDIHYLGNNKVKVLGLALWGKQKECGPNLGELDFEAELKNSKIYFKHTILGDKEYQIEIEFNADGLKAKEKYLSGCLEVDVRSGYFGLNVSFQGDYKKT